MSETKGKVFIGSSSESLNEAKVVKSSLEPDFDCDLWSEHFFEYGSSTFDTLLRKAPMYDFAVFIGGVDDKISRVKNGDERLSSRDNVYLEFALWAGVLSVCRSVFVVDKRVKIPSDLLGITLFQYSDEQSLRQTCRQAREVFIEETRVNRIQLLPSTSLAIGYYSNFIKQIVASLSSGADIITSRGPLPYRLGGYSIDVVIPQNTETDWRAWDEEYAHKNGLIRLTIQGSTRPIGVKAASFDGSDGQLRLVDIPHTLSVAFEAVEMVSKKDFVGSTETIKATKEREARNFVATLNNLVKTDIRASRTVRIIRVPDSDLS